MARLPSWLGFLRPLVAKGRVFALRALGLYELRNLVGTRGGVTTAADLLMVRLSDRISIVESQINWRLYGLPPRVCNVKLEQAQLLSASGDVEDALKRLAPLCQDLALDALSSVVTFKTKENAFLFQGTPSENAIIEKMIQGFNRVTIVEDEAELFYAINQTSKTFISLQADKTDRLAVPAASALARLGQPEFNYIWFSSVFERLTPIQIQIALARASKALLPTGVCAGYFLDYALTDQGAYWLDPRRLRPLTRKFVQAVVLGAGFSKIEFVATQKPDLFYFKCEK